MLLYVKIQGDVMKRNGSLLIVFLFFIHVVRGSSLIEVRPQELIFGIVGIGSATTKNIEIKNLYDSQIIIQNTYLQNGTAFQAEKIINYRLQSGQTKSLTVQFDPTAELFYSDVLIIQVEINSQQYTYRIPIEGVGVHSFFDKLSTPFIVHPGTNESGYYLLSLPGKKRSLIDFLIQNLGKPNTKRWRAFCYQGEWKELKEGEDPDWAEAFFLLQNVSEKALTISDLLTYKDTSYQILLKSGWNLIRNPYLFPVSMEHIGLKKGNTPYFYSYLGTWKLETILYPWYGYAIHVEEDDTLIIRGYEQIKNGSLGKSLLSGLGQIKVKVDSLIDESNYFGFAPHSIMVAKPNFFSTSLQSFFSGENGERSSISLHDKHKKWEFYVQAPEGKEVELIFENLPLPIANKQWILEDNDIEIPLSSHSFYRYTQHHRIHHFILRMKDFSSYRQKNQICTIYPNPGNPMFHIQFKLRQPQRVKILIFNSLGQTIRHLVDEKLVEGVYNVRWSGTNGKGDTVPSGIYFVYFQAGEKRESFKIYLIK